MSILSYIYRNGLWISVPLFILSVALLAYFILNVIRVVKQAHLRSVPLLEQQEIEFSRGGPCRFVHARSLALTPLRESRLRADRRRHPHRGPNDLVSQQDIGFFMGQNGSEKLQNPEAGALHPADQGA